MAGLHWFGVVQYIGSDRLDDWTAFYRELFGFDELPAGQRFGILPKGRILRSPCSSFYLQLIEPEPGVLDVKDDECLQRMGLDYVDIFYSHRFDPDTPLEETMGALDAAVRSGKARYVGISSYSGTRTREAIAILRDLGTPLLIHQPSYSMLNRWVEEDLLDVLGEEGVGCIAFSPLAQGMLTDKYLNGIPSGSRASQGKSLSPNLLSEQNLTHIRALDAMAQERGQSLVQLALAWILRDSRVTSALIGASSVTQLENSVGAVANLDFSEDELDAIDAHAVEGGINLWKGPSRA